MEVTSFPNVTPIAPFFPATTDSSVVVAIDDDDDVSVDHQPSPIRAAFARCEDAVQARKSFAPQLVACRRRQPL